MKWSEVALHMDHHENLLGFTRKTRYNVSKNGINFCV